MDNPSRDPNGTQDGKRREGSKEAVKRVKQITERERMVLQQRAAVFRPEVHGQFQRIFGEGPPLPYTLRPATKQLFHRLIENTILGYTIENNRMLNDPEAEAIGQLQAEAINHSSMADKLSMVLSAGLVYRRRAVYNSAFFSNVVWPPISPHGRSPRHPVTLLWHGIRFLGYHTLISITIAPVFVQVAFARSSAATVRDIRLSSPLKSPSRTTMALIIESTKNPQNQWQEGSGGFRNDQYSGQADPRAAMASGYSNRQTTEQGSRSQGEAPYDWPAASEQPSTYDTGESNKRSWGSNADAVVDDGSPIAPPYQGQEQQNNNNNTASTSWDKIRRQAGGQPTGDPAPRSSDQGWGNDQPASGSGQGSTSWGGSQDYSSSSSSSNNRGSSQRQAQNEFDALLEKERGGDEAQGASSWRRR